MKSSRLSRKNQKEKVNSKTNQLEDICEVSSPRSSQRYRGNNSDSDEKLIVSPSKKATSFNMLILDEPKYEVKEEISNGFRINGFSQSGRSQKICSLANLGNTCFLNSVIYALRFLPGFVHNLHHLNSYIDLKQQESTALTNRLKFLSDFHNLFSTMKNEEYNWSDNKRISPHHPIKFLESVRSINPLFEGNRQQDAHELLHSILDQLSNLPQDLLSNDEKEKELRGESSPKAKRKKKSESMTELEISKVYDFIGSTFLGEMSLATRCSECETVNSRDERFLEVCIPVKTKADLEDDEQKSEFEILMDALCKEDSLVGNNKYWCDICAHHNNAERFVNYRVLPHNLLIHLKRFSSYNTRMAANKCCEAMPAPFQLSCFCQLCIDSNTVPKNVKQSQANGHVTANVPNSIASNTRTSRRNANLSASSSQEEKKSKTNDNCKEKANDHLPYNLSAFVCHLGATISSGHYISYVRVKGQSSSECLAKIHSKKDENSSKDDKEKKGDCSYVSCCSSHVDYESMNNFINSSDDKNPISHDGIWLECDDEKIRIVSFNEVRDAMLSDTSTPYLLFYSR